MQSRVPWWFRVFLLVASAQILVIGLSGLLVPAHITIPLTVSPLNARFIGALYLAGGLGLGLSALVRDVYDARIFVVGFGTITIAVLTVTLANWSTFTADGIPWVWTVTYVADPLLVPVALTATGLWRPRQFGSHRLTPVFATVAAILAGTGLLLLLFPHTAADIWPWGMTALLSRLYASFFLAYALGILLCAWERRAAATLAVRASTTLLGALVIVATVQHLDRFKSTGAELIWFTAFAALCVVFLLTLIPPRVFRPMRTPADRPGQA